MRKAYCGSALLSQAIAVPPTRERPVVIAHLSRTAPVTGASLEALCRVLCHCSALGARTGRALQNGLHTGRLQALGCAFGGGPSVWGPLGDAIGCAFGGSAPTMAIPALPQRARCPLSQYTPPRRLLANGEAFVLLLDRAHAVLQCAPRARTKGRGVLRIRQSASKDGAVEDRAGKGL